MGFVKIRWRQFSGGGGRTELKELKLLFDDTVEEFLRNGLISSEQGIFTWLIKKNPELFDLVRTNHYDEIIYRVANLPLQVL